MSRIPEFEIRDNEKFRVVYVTGVSGGLAPNDGRMIFYLDLVKTKPVRGTPGKEELDLVVRERQAEIHMSPATWKSISKWMISNVEALEKQFGVITEKPKLEDSKSGGSLEHIV